MKSQRTTETLFNDMEDIKSYSNIYTLMKTII